MLTSLLEAKTVLNYPKLSNLETHFLVDHGYLLLDSFLSNEIDRPCQLIKETLERTGIPTSRETALEWISAKSKLQRNNEFLALINETKVKDFLENKLIGKIKKIKSCQIASRFHGEQCIDNLVPDNWYKKWHIDNFTEKDFERRSVPPEFTCLVGVYLTDNEEEFAGNYTLFHGAHYGIQSLSKIKGGYQYYVGNGLDGAREILKLNNPYQVKAKKGSVIIVNRFLPHLISAPNMSEKIRTIVWFRVSTEKKEESFMNIWKEWPKIYGPINLKTECPIQFRDQINEIELKGYGHLVTFDDKCITLRLRQFNSEPCMFASMITVTLYEKHIEVHTNGFINRTKHPIMAKQIMKSCKSLIEIAEWINKCDYEKLINSWYPNDNKLSGIVIKKKLMFHHLFSRSKTGMMVKWEKELSINIEIIKGKPGFLIIEGDSNMVNIFMNRFGCFHWKTVKEILV